MSKLVPLGLVMAEIVEAQARHDVAMARKQVEMLEAQERQFRAALLMAATVAGECRDCRACGERVAIFRPRSPSSRALALNLLTGADHADECDGVAGDSR